MRMFSSTTMIPPTAFIPPTGADNYPRIGLGTVGNPQTYDATTRTSMARFHVVFISGAFDGWPSTVTYTRQAVVADILSKSAVNTKVFNYVNFLEVNQTTPWFAAWKTACDTNNWWLYNNGTSGGQVASIYNAAWTYMNPTRSCPTDSNGRYPYQAAAQFVLDFFVNGTYGSGNVATNLAGVFIDNISGKPLHSGDFDRDGTTDTATAAQVLFRTGLKDFFDYLHANWTGKLIAGNESNWPNVLGTSPSNVGDPLTNIVDVSFGEYLVGGLAGTDPTYETTTANLMTTYKFEFDVLSSTQPILLFVHQWLASNGTDRQDTTHTYRSLRYGMAACAMGDGYFYGSPAESYRADAINWFDEFDGGGTLGVGWLGQPTQTWRTAAWSNGVWRRDFDDGIVLMNPKGNGSQTVALGGTFYRLRGTQDTTANSAAAVTSVTLADRDGLFLSRIPT